MKELERKLKHLKLQGKEHGLPRGKSRPRGRGIDSMTSPYTGFRSVTLKEKKKVGQKIYI